MVKCLAKSGVIFVTTIADVPQKALQKAESLRHKILRHKSITAATKATTCTKPKPAGNNNRRDNQSPPKNIANIPKKQPIKNIQKPSNSVEIRKLERSQSTVLSSLECLRRAERSLRDSGFYSNINFENDTVSGFYNNDSLGQTNEYYNGSIQCSPNDIIFKVTGPQSATKIKLLNLLEKKF